MIDSQHAAECKKAWDNYERTVDLSKRVKNAVHGVMVELPEKPEDFTSIPNYGLPKSERKFPKHSDELIRQIDELPFDSPEKIAYIDEMLDRRYNGFFWYNGDNLEWIDGKYYMTLQYWKIPVEDEYGGRTATPRFVDAQRDINLACWQGEKDKRCSGLLFIGGRRSSKTVTGMARGYWDTTEKENAVFAIQSKTFPDAKKVLGKLVKSWQHLPMFLRPTDTGESTVTTTLRFEEPKTRGKTRKKYSKVLNSYIEAFNAKEEAVDGLRTTYQFQDEIGKTLDADVDQRQKIARVSCFTAGGAKVIGFAFWATTVEEMEKKGGANALKVWQKSDPSERSANGRTKNTMYRLFFPAEYGMFEGEDPSTGEKFVDEWGYSNVPLASKYLDAEEAILSGEDLKDQKRKFPRCIEDAFALAGAENNYNQAKIGGQINYNDHMPNSPLVRGNFYWDGGIKDTEVKFSPHEDGRWLVAWMPEPEDRNRFALGADGHRHPTRDFIVTGIDPFSHRATVDKGSLGAATSLLTSHHTAKFKMGFVCHYLYRQEHPHKFFEDMIMQAVFYSSKVLPESNKYGVIDYFDKRGYDGYIVYNPLDPESEMKYAKGHRGIAMTHNDTREALMNITQAYIEDYIGKNFETGEWGWCPFNDILKDWKNFDPNKWTVYDSAVSAGIALIGAKKPKVVRRKVWKKEDWFGR